MLKTYFLPRFLRGAKCFVLNLTLTLTLLAKSYVVLAEQDPAKQNLQTVAAANAQELGGVTASNQWVRIEFSKPYIDPIIVVESPVNNSNNPYIVGIRNVDATGFQINLKSCNQAPGIPLQENISYSVIENSELSSSEGKAPVRQVYAWGECPT